MTEISDEQLAAVTKLSAPERYSFFIRRVADRRELWTLRDGDGFVLYADDERRELVPVWPDRWLAEAWRRKAGLSPSFRWRVTRASWLVPTSWPAISSRNANSANKILKVALQTRAT